MRKKLALAAILGAIVLVGGLPGFILGRVGRYQVVSPQVVPYRPSVRCEGQVYPAEGYDLLSSGLYLVEECYVSLGDPVYEGEVLATLVPVAGQAVLYLQTRGNGTDRESGQSSLEALARSYSGTGAQPELSGLDLWPVGEGSGKEEAVTVTSPVAGVVTREVPAPGSVVQPGAVITSVEGREEYLARLTVGEKDAAKLSVGNQAILSGEGVGPEPCGGTVTKIYPGTRKELSGTVTQNVVDIEVTIQPEGQEIRPGFSVKAQIFTEDERLMMVVPYESVRQDGDNVEYVMVAGQYRLEKRPVTTGQETLDGVEILEGLLPDELVTVLPEEGEGEGQERYLLELGKEG